MRPTRLLRALVPTALVLLGACETLPDGLWPTPQGTGPRVTFDLLAKPLPEIPFPNDMATRLDVDSPTGRRVNASVAAPTLLEKEVREEFNLLDGWGTFAPITVSFETPIEPNDVRARHLDDDFANDAVYLVDLTTGEPVALDLGRGNFPVVVQNNDKYFLNDPRVDGSNLLFETYEEVDRNGNGRLDPEEDTDSDGVWDHPNTVDPTRPLHGVAHSRDETPDKAPPAERGNDRYRDLLTFYERESNTLIVRPVVPLAQRTTYAVVLTNRIKGADGQPVRSPFPFVNHAAQTEQLRPLLGFLGKGRLAGLTDQDVAFAWAFTTQSVTTDLEEIRKGLFGEGKLAKALSQVDARLEPVTFIDRNQESPVAAEHPVHPLRDSKAAKGKNLYTVPIADFREAFNKLTKEAFNLDEGPDKDALMESYKFVDYFVVGSFKTPDFLDDPSKPTFDAVFRMNAQAGNARLWTRPENWKQIEVDALEAAWSDPTGEETAKKRQAAKRATRDRVYFMLAVPKPQPGLQAPFPVAIYGHGYTSNRPEMLGFAGNLAKFGIATVAIDSYGHGLDVAQTDRAAIEAIINQYGFGPLTQALFEGRSRDLDNDDIDNSGGDFWVADTFHTRDVVRQSIVDWMQLARVFHAFGSYEMGDVDGDGRSELAGDFNADGVIDVAGPKELNGQKNPGYDFFVWGQSLGGILAGILPAVEPSIAAAAPVSGGAGLADIGIRSEQGGVIEAVFLEILGPVLAGRPRGDGGTDLVYEVQDVNSDTRVTIASLAPGAIKPGDRIELLNLDTDDRQERKFDWALAGADGTFRLQVGADSASFFDGAPVDATPIHVGSPTCDPATAATADALMLRRPADCLVFRRIRPNDPDDLVIDTFESDVVFQKRHFAKDTPLVALARGFGMKRGNKVFRRFMSLAQTILEAGDPANYAAHYFREPLEARKGNPAAVLVVGTTGDLNVPVNTAYSQARTAGVLPYVYDPAKHAAWKTSPNDVLIRSKATECIEKLEYFTPVADHLRKPDDAVDPVDQPLVDLVTCVKPEDCDGKVLVDPGLYAFDAASQTFLDVGNRLGDNRVRNHGAPRLRTGLRDAVQATYPTADGQQRMSALITPYLDDTGKHGFDLPHPTDPFDIDLFMINLIGRFFQSRGTDLRFDTCMHRDGYDRPRLKPDHPKGTLPEVDAAARRVDACAFIPPYPDHW